MLTSRLPLIIKSILSLFLLTFSMSLAPSSYPPSLRRVEGRIEPSVASYKALASTLHFEARGEPRHCQKAVVDVVLNRAKQQKKSVEKIVSAPYQFSFIKIGQKIPRAPAYWDVVAKAFLVQDMQGLRKDSTRGATFFFRHDSDNYLVGKLKLVYSCGQHNFYREA